MIFVHKVRIFKRHPRRQICVQTAVTCRNDCVSQVLRLWCLRLARSLLRPIGARHFILLELQQKYVFNNATLDVHSDTDLALRCFSSEDCVRAALPSVSFRHRCSGKHSQGSRITCFSAQRNSSCWPLEGHHSSPGTTANDSRAHGKWPTSFCGFYWKSHLLIHMLHDVHHLWHWG